MQCLGRTSLKNRCRNRAKWLFVCNRHVWQPFVLLLIAIPSIYADWSAIYRDVAYLIGDRAKRPLAIEPFPEHDQSFKILILPFDPLEDCQIQETDMAKTIYKRLVELKERSSLEISVRYDTNLYCPAGFEEGKSIGKRLNADLILWGETYEKCEVDTLKACLRYVLLRGEGIPIGTHGSTGIQGVSSMTDISQGYLQRDIDYVVFWTLGSEAYAQGRYQDAVERFSKMHELSADDPEILNWQGLSLHAAGKYTEAEPLYRRALAINEKQLGPEHPDVAISLNNLAGLFHAQGKYAEAEPLYRRALAINEKQLGPEHPSIATSLNNLAELLRAQGKHAETESLLRRALEIREKQLGAEHPFVASSLNNLAELLRAQGEYTEAEPLFRRALMIVEKQLGPEHPDVAMSLNNLATLFHAQGKYADAEALYLRALEIWEKQLGPEHPSVAMSLNNLALLLDAQGKYAEAEPLLRRALEIREKQLGPEYPDVVMSLNNLAGLLRTKGKYGEAEPLLRSALEIWEKQLGPKHPDTKMARQHLAILQKQMPGH